ncbi:BspA family leucine-rich repeat surface protein [Candidatus Haliotispira prima]|uniref:BspA family leucine-rich repeat surface protein n=1 Tax=Candidatus Haliotispira prima TaxID=3034016 RepID=A0ABY8MJE7_9SPIO|nr:BspA family leucine-rich repeat surface protein [Candidatus Haliotispira prima]
MPKVVRVELKGFTDTGDVPLGGTASLNIVTEPADAAKDVRWKVEGDSAVVGSISAAGVYTAPSRYPGVPVNIVAGSIKVPDIEGKMAIRISLPERCQAISRTEHPTTKTELEALVNAAIAADPGVDLNYIDTFAITNMAGLFTSKGSFNGDISCWDTSNVSDMSLMFANASDFDRNIADWDTHKVVDMSFMFNGASSFNQDIGSWNTSAAENMESMFQNAVAFNRDIGSWDVGNVTSMDQMFFLASKFSQNLNRWNVIGVANHQKIFWGAAMNGDTTLYPDPGW